MKPRLAYLVILLFLPLARLQDAAVAGSPEPTPDQQRVHVLVELLASKNKVSGRSPDADFPKDYDRNAQVVVYLAIRQLLAEGSTAFDTLIDHFNDKRYSYTYAAPDDKYNATVGNVCYSIMTECIKCYRNEIHTITEEQYRLGPDFQNDLAKWWKQNRHRPLWEIQVEAIDRAIELMEKVRRDGTRVPWRFAEELTPKVFESRRKENLKILKGMRFSILSQQEAYRPKSLEKRRDFRYDAMLGLPWWTNPR